MPGFGSEPMKHWGTLGHTCQKDGEGELVVRSKFYSTAMPSKMEGLGEP